MLKNWFLFIISLVLASCKSSSIALSKRHSPITTVYKRVHPESEPIVTGQIVAALPDDYLLVATIFVDGQQMLQYVSETGKDYVLPLAPGVHKISIVTVTYITTVTTVDVQRGDSLRMNYYLQPQLAPLRSSIEHK